MLTLLEQKSKKTFQAHLYGKDGKENRYPFKRENRRNIKKYRKSKIHCRRH